MGLNHHGISEIYLRQDRNPTNSHGVRRTLKRRKTMRKMLAAALYLLLVLPCAVKAQPAARPTGQEARPDAERPREIVFKPQLSQEQKAQLATLRNKKVLCPGQFPTPTIAVSVAGQWLGTGGA